jgi:hypothetical protein
MMNPDIDVRYSKMIELGMLQDPDTNFFSEIRTDFDMKIPTLHKVPLEKNDPCAG